MTKINTGRPLIVMALKQESQGLFEARGYKPFYCGLGQIKAAHHLTRKLTDCSKSERPNLIINLGTAGSFHHSQGQLVEVKGFVCRNHFLPPQKTILTLNCMTDLPKVICGTGDTVETNNSSCEYKIMDMEGYALAYVAKQFQIPLISIKYISDNSDDNTLRDWKSCLDHSAKMLLDSYKQLQSIHFKLHP